MKIAPDIFRAYDIRGIYPQQLNVESVHRIGQAIAQLALEQQQSQIIVARDGRLSGPELATGLMDGIKSMGCDVIDIGAVPTPVLYFATYELRCPNGVMVTGSHNPSEYNGLKIVINHHTLAGDEIADLYRRCHSVEPVNATSAQVSQHDMVPQYIERIAQEIQLKRTLKIVVDAGNGIVGHVAPALYRALGCQVEELFCEVDGHFPNHHPDPSEADNLQTLRDRVRATGADLGLAFDGDGDRLGIITHQGEIIYPDRQMIIFSEQVLQQHPGATIIYDVKCTKHLPARIRQAGGQPIMTKTGHSFVKAELKERAAKLAGEMSGHIFFADRWYGFDDGIYAGARCLEILSAAPDQTKLWQAIPDSCNTPEIKIPIADDQKFSFIERFIQSAPFESASMTTIDGLRVEFDDGWGLLRASNTTPCLVLRFEADDELALARIKQSFKQAIQALDKTLRCEF